MKKVKSSDRGSAARDKGDPKAVDQYLARVPEPARSTLNRVRAAIRSAVPPESTEAIGYRIPTFRYKGALLAYAAFSDHCSLFPMSLAVMAAFKNDLKGYSTLKGTIHFPLDKPLPAVLVKKLVKARIAEKELKKWR
ncbi:MAG: iron chaperone [Candidatus Acidiferrales bacterium]